jgi:hypothetical protein
VVSYHPDSRPSLRARLRLPLHDSRARQPQPARTPRAGTLLICTRGRAIPVSMRTSIGDLVRRRASARRSPRYHRSSWGCHRLPPGLLFLDMRRVCGIIAASLTILSRFRTPLGGIGVDRKRTQRTKRSVIHTCAAFFRPHAEGACLAAFRYRRGRPSVRVCGCPRGCRRCDQFLTTTATVRLPLLPAMSYARTTTM